jgi:hypothetical protein
MIHARWPKVGNALDATFGALIILPAVMILFSGMRFLGSDISEMHSNAVIEDLGGEVTTSVMYLAAYAMIVFGILILIFGLVLMKKGISRVRWGRGGRPRATPPPPGPAGAPPRPAAPPPPPPPQPRAASAPRGPPGPPPQRPGYGYDGGGY